jgi:hypothetical protein
MLTRLRRGYRYARARFASGGFNTGVVNGDRLFLSFIGYFHQIMQNRFLNKASRSLRVRSFMVEVLARGWGWRGGHVFAFDDKRRYDSPFPPSPR